MKSLTAFWLLLRGGAHIAGGWWTIRTRFPRLTQSQREAEVQRWARNFLRVWRIDLQVNGAPPKDGPLLMVVNHISWLDILVLHAAGFCRFVSKADVQHWPVIGRMATGAGTLYIARDSRRDALRVVHHMRDALLRGEAQLYAMENKLGLLSLNRGLHALRKELSGLDADRIGERLDALIEISEGGHGV